jgi:YD repeat-containing protein
MSYNSLIWTKQGTNIYFDTDNSNISPGFRFGFPTIEPSYLDTATGKFAFLMVSPSGGRTEFRQIGASSTYETADSSYTQLKFKGADTPNAVEALEITVTGTDGTKMSFAWLAGAYRASKIMDANGNFVTILHDQNGLLQSVTDTLGRVINVSYDANLYPTTVTQTWKDNNGTGANITHTYATFGYGTTTIDTNFHSSLGVFGPINSTVLKVLNKVTFTDGSSTNFEYNGYGQVRKITNIAADSPTHELNYVSTNLDSVSGVQTDCPRFSETRSWVENFNLNENGVAQAVVIPNDFLTNQTYTLPNGGTANGNLIQITTPDGNGGSIVSKTYTGMTGWREGLPMVTKDSANGVEKRWTQTTYTQDDENLSYIQNPRVIESKVGDTENSFVRKTTVEYWPQTVGSPIALYGLPKFTKVFDNDGTTILKQSYTEYNLATAYTSRRIIGLPSLSEQWGYENGVGLTKVSKTTYAYDEDLFDNPALQQVIAPIMHNTIGYGASFKVGRGNLSTVTRWDVTGALPNMVSKVKYNVAGSSVASIDPLNRTLKTSYTDKFNDGVNRNTFAFPTKLTDPAENFSEIKYRYDIGANVWDQSPSPVVGQIGKTTTREYDNQGRPTKETLANTGVYTRYEYPTNGVQSKVFTTITDFNNNGTGDSGDEVMSEIWTDGVGRERRARTEHPNSTGGWSGSITEYDILGQVKRSTVPTEITVPNENNPDTWAAAGDDANRGFLWMQHEYDWKGRPTREINTDGTDKLFTYNGCGCAGGQVTTIQGELVPRDDIPTQNARRTQKIYSDILGRTYKTESMKWHGTTVYSTNLTTFNGRDQVLTAIEQDNSKSPMVSQTSSMTYDGFGRVKTQHIPQQNANTATVYNYNADNTVQNVTDARGATSHFIYNSLGLLQQKSYSVPNGSNIPVTPTVTYVYDNLGNRTQMNDGLGTATYQYDQFSRMTSETRGFTDNTSYTTNYTYQFNGALKSITDPSGGTITWGNDKIGRNVTVTDSVGGNVANLITNQTYRAWGARKKIIGGTGHETDYNYNNRLQLANISTIDTLGRHGPNNAPVDNGNVNFTYNADGTMSQTQTTLSAYSPILFPTKSYKYDSQMRMSKEVIASYSNKEFEYDGFNHNTLLASSAYIFGPPQTVNSTWVNNRNIDLSPPETGEGATYDADGRVVKTREVAIIYRNSVLSITRSEHKFDAAGNMVGFRSMYDGDEHHKNWTYAFDGDGREIKIFNSVANTTKVSIYSSLTGSVLGTVFNSNFTTNYFERGFNNNISIAPDVKSSATFTIGLKISLPNNDDLSLNSLVRPYDPTNGNSAMGFEQNDSLGNWLVMPDLPDPELPPQTVDYDPMFDNWEGTTNDISGGCTYNGQPKNCAEVISLMEGGSAERDNGPFKLIMASNGNTRAAFNHDNSPSALTSSGRWVGKTGQAGVVNSDGTTTWGDASTDWEFVAENYSDNKEWSISGFTKEQKTIIQDQVMSMYLSDACAKAFEAAGLQSVKTMMNSGNLRIFHKEILGSSTNNSQWAGNEDMRKKMLAIWNKDYEYSGLTAVGPQKGNYYVSFSNRTFTGWEDTTINIIIHELIHAGGKEGARPTDIPNVYNVPLIGKKQWGNIDFSSASGKHDLASMNYNSKGEKTKLYDNIIAACQPTAK